MNVAPVVLNYNAPCDYCHKPFKRLYPLMIDDQRFMFCSGPHFEQAKNNWEEKKRLGADKPGIPPNLNMQSEPMTDMELPEDE